MSSSILTRALLGAAVTSTAQELLLGITRGSPTWERKNFRGRSVNLSGGVATAAAALVAAAVAGDYRAAAVLTTAVAAATGCADDFAADPTSAKGLRGHLKALRRGQITTGAMKLLGISAAALTSAGLISRARPAPTATRLVDVLTSGALIAGTANLINLFDLRPGRAVKVTGLLAGLLAADPTNPGGRTLAATTAGIAFGAGPRDLRENTMLGDVGANSLGALLGIALAQHPRLGIRAGALTAVLALILASEKVSFSKVIDTTAALAWADRLGRVP